MEGLFVVISRHSFDYVAWGGAIDCLFYIFLCSLLDAILGTFFAFYITFHFFRCSTCFFHAYFAWGGAII
jgi:hypothetical protein